jgi:hypothetical protein
MAKKSDRQQCSDDWKELTAKRPKVIFKKEYVGFEAIADIDRDVCEAFDTDFNPLAEQIPDEHQGTVTVTITYTPEKS